MFGYVLAYLFVVGGVYSYRNATSKGAAMESDGPFRRIEAYNVDTCKLR